MTLTTTHLSPLSAHLCQWAKFSIKANSTLNQIPFAVVLKAASNAIQGGYLLCPVPEQLVHILFLWQIRVTSYFRVEVHNYLTRRIISILSCSTAVGPHLTFLWQLCVTSYSYFRVLNYLTYLCFTHNHRRRVRGEVPPSIGLHLFRLHTACG